MEYDHIKVYPYTLMAYHEVINEVGDGAPVMIAYCYLADLAAVYSRVYCGKEFTFAVSGTMKDETLRKHDRNKWGYKTWGELKTNYPNALVFQTQENWLPPPNLPIYQCSDLECCNE